jgi:AraC-like DNA-binding protein
MRYEEFPPPPALARYVRCVWTFEAARNENTGRERIVPDGRCELIVHLGDPFAESSVDGRESEQPRVFFAGQLSHPLWLRATGRAHVIGVRFHAWSARRFLGESVTSATDRRVPVEGCDAASIDEVARFVEGRVAANREGDDPIVEQSAGELERTSGRASIDEIVSASGLGRRQLERRFRDAVGLSPRLFANVLRLRSVFDALQANPEGGWTDAALAAGYFDQSHLIRDFRRFVGCTPAQFLAAERGLAAEIATA